MKRYPFLALIFFFSSLQCLLAVDLDIYGIKIISERTENDLTVFEAEDSDGKAFSFISDKELDRTQAEILNGILEIFLSWEHINIDSMSIIFSGNRAEIIIMPGIFNYKGTELSGYMPSGMQFYYSTYLEYDFRIRIKSLFLRIKGQYFTEEQFSEKVLDAVKNPVVYIQTHDPEYVIRKFEEIDQSVEKLVWEDDVLVQHLGDFEREYQALKDDYNDVKDDYYALKEDYNDTKTDHRSLKEDYFSLKNDYFSLKDDYNAVKEDYYDLKDNYEKLKKDYLKNAAEFQLQRYALLALHNFRKPLDKKVIERILALKEAEPGLTHKEVVVRLKDEGVKTTARAVSLVFNVYFNEFK